ncbi:hypothetical protein HPB49_013297 [Dermacentor silvarum]|uniref:Uncharacterized protein n=1 Tax=Dermacentor silvarum TaxID=543639 RepID=A0ACB8DDB0_DERSI|nr:hypothetical protein HPB49_013297 [Dermacentor silvarum]
MIAQVTLLLVISTVAFAGGHGGYGHHGGSSKTYRKQNDHGHYSFGYDIVNGYGAVNGRHETGSAYGPVHGSYYLGDIDGRHRQVHYVADKLGFRAMVKTNEPGTKSSLPAAAPYHSAHGKTVTLLLVISTVAFAGGHGGYGHHGGSSRTYRKQNDHGHYGFGYDIVNGYGAVNGRHETGSAYGPVHGSYYLGDIDGRHRQVHYVADKLGFRAMVKTNEPGTKSSLPAAAPYHSAHGKTCGKVNTQQILSTWSPENDRMLKARSSFSEAMFYTYEFVH